MSQQLASFSRTRDFSVTSTGIGKRIQGAVVLLGVVAPLLLVLGVDCYTSDALLRAHCIVHGCTVLALSLGATTFVSVLYLLGMHEAQLLAMPFTPRLHLTNA